MSEMYKIKRPRLCGDYMAQYEKREKNLWSGEYGVDVNEVLKPLDSVKDVREKEKILKVLDDNTLELSSYELMKTIEQEQKKTLHLRRLMKIFLQDDIEFADTELVDKNDTREVETLQSVLEKLQEVISSSDEYISRLTNMRDKIVRVNNQRPRHKSSLLKFIRTKDKKRSKKS